MKNVYESEAFAQLPDRSMHPGGLRLTDRAVRLAALQAGSRVADIGCGSGATCAYLADKYQLNTVGFEISAELVAAGMKQHPGQQLIRWDCQALPFEEDCLDTIIFECTLSVIGKAEQVINDCAKALKPSGTVIISDVFIKQERAATNDLLFSVTAFEGLLQNAGLSVILTEDHTSALRTFTSELKALTPDGFDAGMFFSSCPIADGVLLSELGYYLIIARKI